MIKRKNFVFLKTLAINSVFLSLGSSCFSCSNNTPTIFFPTKKNIESSLTEDGYSICMIDGFHFSGLSSSQLQEMHVDTSFKQGYAEFRASIVNIDLDKQEFNVSIEIFNAFPASISGEIIFKLFGTEIKLSGSDVFSIQMNGHVSIESPEEKMVETTIDDNMSCQAVFKNFVFHNINDWSRFKVEAQFFGEIDYEMEIIKAPHNSFDILFNIVDTIPGDITLKFQFKYNNSILLDVPLDIFIIKVNGSPSITEPDTHTQMVTLINDEGTVDIHNFHYTFMDSFDNLIVKNEHGDDESISIWATLDDKTTKSFTVHIKFNWDSIREPSKKFKFVFVQNGNIIPSEHHEFTIIVHSSIPERFFDIQKNESGLYVIKSLKKEDPSLDLSKYDSVLIPEKISEVSDSAFENAFPNDSTIKHLLFHDLCQLRRIGNRAFFGCKNFVANGSIGQEFSLPDSLIEIGESAFEDCINLKDSLFLPSCLRILGKRAFYGCSGLVGSLTLPEQVTEIPDECFGGCTSLASLTLSTSLNKIGVNAFTNCSFYQQESLEIPGTCSLLEKNAFANLPNIRKVVIYDGIQTIGEGVFANCGNLVEIFLGYHEDLPSWITSSVTNCFSNLTSENGGAVIIPYVSDISTWEQPLRDNCALPSNWIVERHVDLNR